MGLKTQRASTKQQPGSPYGAVKGKLFSGEYNMSHYGIFISAEECIH